MGELILELALIMGIAAILALIGRAIKQPPIIAYLITGILIGPLVFNLMGSTEMIHTFARMGVAFLLFIVGLNLDFRELKGLGKVSFLAGITEILVVSSLAFIIAITIGFSYTPAIYLAVAFAFSSTVVVVKLLSDKNELETLHGRIALGILIIEDFVAAFVLMIVPVLGSGDFSTIFTQVGTSILLIAGVFLFAYLIFPGALAIAAKSQEVLFLFGISWALLVSVLFDILGFSMEIGALLAGMALASSKYSLEIKGKIKGIMDFFVVLFFVFFGSQLVGPITSDLIINASIFSAFILLGKPLIIMTIMKTIGYKKRTNFFTGTSLAQISEFSLILILLGFTLGIVTQELFSLVILIALITITLSSYSIHFSKSIYKSLSPILRIFDGHKHELGIGKKTAKHDIILLGYNRIGFNLLKAFEKTKKKYLVIDYNPKTVLKLSKQGINCIYGDVNDLEMLRSVHVTKAKIIISTIPDLEANLEVMDILKDKKIIFIPTSHTISHTKKLYAAGASYVIMPHFLGGHFVAQMLVRDKFNKKKLFKEGEKQKKELDERLFEGHDHPRKGFHGT